MLLKKRKVLAMFSGYTRLGIAAGAAVGGVVGTVAGGTVWALFGYSVAIGLVVLFAFLTIFAVYGGFMGMLLDIDVREKASSGNPLPPQKFETDRFKTRPLVVSR